MFVFDGLRRAHEPNIARGKNRFAVIHPKGLQQKQRPMQFRSHLSERQFAIKFQLGLLIGLREPRPRVAVQMLSKFFDVGTGQSKADRVRMSAVPRK